jgi:hypothetical protein
MIIIFEAGEAVRGGQSALKLIVAVSDPTATREHSCLLSCSESSQESSCLAATVIQQRSLFSKSLRPNLCGSMEESN